MRPMSSIVALGSLVLVAFVGGLYMPIGSRLLTLRPLLSLRHLLDYSRPAFRGGVVVVAAAVAAFG